MEMARGKQKQARTIFQSTKRHTGSVVICVVMLFFSLLLASGIVFRGKIVPGVMVGRVHLGNRTLGEARNILERAVRAYTQSAVRITIDTGTLSPDLADLGFTVNIEGTLDRAYAKGRWSRFSNWFALPARAQTTGGVLVIEYDRAVFDAYLTSIRDRFRVEPLEPSLSVQTGDIVVQPGREGKTVTVPDFFQDLQRSVATLQPMEVSAVVDAVSPRTSESSLTIARAMYEKAVASPIILVSGEKRYALDEDTLKKCVVLRLAPANTNDVQPEIDFTFDRRPAREFFHAIANDLSLEPKKAHAYVSEQHGEYALRNVDGRAFDEQTTIERVLSVLQGGGERNVEIAIKTLPAILEYETIAAPKPSGKVISVDLTKQIAFAHEDGRLIFWTHVSTGKGSYKTPTGIWKVYGKTAKQVMDGPGYYLPNVKWVSAYNGDYTLHGTYWHTNFGHPMSHGCTNLSENDAKWFYDWAEIGTPVVIYES
jgi:lipoprotein-anchoring transpeptidase ErfK/SrfK